MKNIYFVSDQLYPRTSADSEQIISSLSALSKFTNVTLLSASYLLKKNPSSKQLEDYYGRKCEFNVSFINHLFKNIRGIEKIAFALTAAVKLRKSNCELVYTRNIPIVMAVLLLTRIPIVFESYRPWPNRNFLANFLFKKLDFDLYNDSDRNITRDKFELPKDQIITTYSGRVNKKKGLLKLLDLAKTFPDQYFLIIGSEKEGVIEEESGKIENVKVLKWQDRKTVFSLLQASDILYLPPTLIARDVSKNTVLPIKTFIYKASGVAIFGPDAEDVKEVLTHKENAYLVEPDNPQKEMKAFRELVENKDLRDRIGNNAKEEMKGMSWSNRAELILEFVQLRMKENQRADA